MNANKARIIAVGELYRCLRKTQGMLPELRQMILAYAEHIDAIEWAPQVKVVEVNKNQPYQDRYALVYLIARCDDGAILPSIAYLDKPTADEVRTIRLSLKLG